VRARMRAWVRACAHVCICVCVCAHARALKEFILILLLCSSFAPFEMDVGEVFSVSAVDTAQINVVSPFCTTF